MAVTRRDAVVIVGMGRSGTSAITRVLSLCGGALPLQLLPANPWNPTGYWEPVQALHMNERFLARHASSWYDATLRLQMRTSPPADATAFIVEICRWMKHGFAGGGPLVVKDPRISALLPYWLAAATVAGLNVKIIHMFRNPTDVAGSLAARDGLTLDHSLALWMKYNLVAEHDTRRLPRVFVSYEELLQNWEPVLRRCIGELDLPLALSEEARGAIRAFLTPALQHHNSGSTVNHVGVIPAGWIRATHMLLNAARNGNCSVSEFDAVRNGYERYVRDVRFVPGTAARSASAGRK